WPISHPSSRPACRSLQSADGRRRPCLRLRPRREPGHRRQPPHPARAALEPSRAVPRAQHVARRGRDAPRRRGRRHRNVSPRAEHRQRAARTSVHSPFSIMNPGMRPRSTDMTADKRPPLRVGIGGPVGSGKTALVDALCKALRQSYQIAVVTNDIYTIEDAQVLTRSGALPEERIVGVETGGCPHTAIREDASINLEAVAALQRRVEDLDLIIIESGGDNLAATFSPELSDLTLYVIDVSRGDKSPRKGGPGITKSDLLI